MENKDGGNGVSMMDWIFDNALICFDMSTNDVEETTAPDKGFLRFFASLAIPPTENYQLWLFPVYPSTMSISRDLSVSLNYTPSAAG